MNGEQRAPCCPAAGMPADAGRRRTVGLLVATGVAAALGPADAEAALSDAAWDVITSIKDRTFQRELMRRSEEVGMLGALLAARHAGASDSLSRLPEAHFAVQAMLGTLTGEDARNAESYRTLLRQLTGELEQAQQGATRTLSDVLRHGLRG